MLCVLFVGGCHDSRLFPPQDLKEFHRSTLVEILEERASRSLNRVCPRGVKRKMSNYPLRPRARSKTIRIDFCAAIRILK
jgi:hypothetical protein